MGFPRNAFRTTCSRHRDLSDSASVVAAVMEVDIDYCFLLLEVIFPDVMKQLFSFLQESKSAIRQIM